MIHVNLAAVPGYSGNGIVTAQEQIRRASILLRAAVHQYRANSERPAIAKHGIGPHRATAAASIAFQALRQFEQRRA